MARIMLEGDIPEDIFNQFGRGEKIKFLLQDFVETDGVEFLRDALEELREETKDEDKEAKNLPPFVAC